MLAPPSHSPSHLATGRWSQHAGLLLTQLRQVTTVSARMQLLAEAFLNRPYRAEALIGGAQEDERLVLDLSAFDCVTFVENTLALARAHNLPSYLRELKATRYDRARVEWQYRLHYFSDWMRANQKRGVLRRPRLGDVVLSYDKTLSSLADYPARRRRLDVVPRPKLLKVAGQIEQGTVVAFASTRAKIDYFHVGLLFWEPQGSPRQKLMFYHASRSLGRVQREPLNQFLGRNRTRGLSLAIPTEEVL